MKEKTLNFHLTDRCNFQCKHCFVNMQGRELTLYDCKKVIDIISTMNEFSRINLAGGEPMMVHHLQDVIDYIVSKELKCSIITNGSYLTTDFIQKNNKKLYMIGISVDSIDDYINKLIGRKTLKNLFNICDNIKKNDIKLKINICISKHNLSYNFKPLIERIKPDRLKVLQILPNPNLNNQDSLIVTKEEFEAVCMDLKKFNPVCENNEFMSGSYHIVDSEGFYGKDNLHLNNSKKIKLI